MAHYFDIEIKVNENLDENQFKQIAVKIKPEWSDQPIETTCIRGGITNSLFACYLKSTGVNHSSTILFRVYGENSEKFISRTAEIETMCLMNKQGLGPQYYGRFKNGICYEFLPGEILDQKMVYDEAIYTKVAKAIAGLHMTQFEGFVFETDLQSDKEIFIFTEIWKLFDLVLDDYKANMPNMTDEYLKLIPSKEDLQKEIQFLQNHITAYTKANKSLIMFSHNDLLLGNIIYNNSIATQIKFIDYEYSCVNYQAYDIANHFNEYAGVDEPNYSYFPNKEYQVKWLRIYLEEFIRLVNQHRATQSAETNLAFSEEKVLQFYEEVNKFTLTSHLMWAVWSLVQAQVSKLDFDFVAYAQIRFNQYFCRKRELNILN